ncbi:MAG: RNA-binding protein [Clostridiales bacterium]|nr:RNA-binding protein [Clostridiales bacterium]
MKLGEYQELYCVKKVAFGVYLAESADSGDKVLLPIKQVPQDLETGDTIRVFVYKDSSDRIIATVNEPRLTVGGLARLRVKEVTDIGAFLDWGLEKDLFLPYKQMTGDLEPGREILVTMYIDKSERLCASMRGIYHLLETKSPYEKGDLVHGRVYEFSDNFGMFVAVSDTFSGRVPKYEDYRGIKVGDVIEARVTDVKKDGKLDLTLRQKPEVQMDLDSQKLLDLLDSYGGVLPFTEKATPEVIKRETGLSKNAFKRAVGHLYREHKISLDNDVIRKAAE